MTRSIRGSYDGSRRDFVRSRLGLVDDARYSDQVELYVDVNGLWELRQLTPPGEPLAEKVLARGRLEVKP